MQSSPSLITRGSLAWPSLTPGSAGLVRLHVADGRKCATGHPAARRSLGRPCSTRDGGGFSRTGAAIATLRIGQTAGRIGRIRHTIGQGNRRVAIGPASAKDAGAAVVAISVVAIFPPPPRRATSHCITPSIPNL